MSYTKIEDIVMLKEMAKTGCECFIHLNGGLRSSKMIDYDEKTGEFNVYNEVDDTEQRLTEAELYTKSNVGEALNKGALRKY